MDARGNWLSSALPPKTSADMQGVLYEGADYRFHGEVNDFVFLMTYEWGWTGGPPMAVAPLNQVRRVLDYAVSEIPNEKIILGIPHFSRLLMRWGRKSIHLNILKIKSLLT